MRTFITYNNISFHFHVENIIIKGDQIRFIFRTIYEVKKLIVDLDNCNIPYKVIENNILMTLNNGIDFLFD